MVNYLGVEIKKVCVDEALKNLPQSGNRNLHFLPGNANVNIGLILQSLPPQSVDTISIMHPDPHFKRRHHKRRVVNDSFVSEVTQQLSPSASIYFQSDVLDTFNAAVEVFDRHSKSWVRDTNSQLDNYFGVRTEREVKVLEEGLPIYRCRYLRL
jgi:tRNA (guanine-N7-)-methyltransferase